MKKLLNKMGHRLGIFFWIHLIIVIFIWVSPFWLDWKIILCFVFLYYLQLVIFKDCILIKEQYHTKKREITIYTQILENFGFRVNRKIIVFLSDYVFPWIILLIAIFRQFVF